MQARSVELPDGDFLETCCAPHDSDEHEVIIHGLEGSQYSHYARRILGTLNRNRIAFTFVHFRGCGKHPNRKDHAYHSGHTEDMDFIFRRLRHEYPGTRMVALGYSLGGNALLKYLGESRSQNNPGGSTAPASLVDKAIAVSPPMQLDACATRLDRGLSRVYRRHLLGRLKRKTLDKFADRSTPPVDIEAVEQCSSFWEFDDLVTARLNDFENVDHYYADSSAKQYLSRINIPTLILQAEDDPFLTPEAIPDKEELSPSIQFELSARGGHVGFVAGTVPGRADYWLEQRILDFIRA